MSCNGLTLLRPFHWRVEPVFMRFDQDSAPGVLVQRTPEPSELGFFTIQRCIWCGGYGCVFGRDMAHSGGSSSIHFQRDYQIPMMFGFPLRDGWPRGWWFRYQAGTGEGSMTSLVIKHGNCLNPPINGGFSRWESHRTRWFSSHAGRVLQSAGVQGFLGFLHDGARNWRQTGHSWAVQPRSQTGRFNLNWWKFRQVIWLHMGLSENRVYSQL